jgi:long-chain fatty acid transport protein
MAKKAFIVILAVSVIAAGAYGGGFALSGVGSKAIGMGGAFRGLADNWSAAYWNPAGLAQVKQTEFNFIGIAINPMPKMTPQIRYGGYEVGYINDEVRYPQGQTHLAANVSGFYRLPSRDDLTFGVAVLAPFALGSKWNLYEPLYSDVAGDFPYWNHEATLKIIDIHPSIAKSFMDDRLMLGAGVSFYRGTIDFRKTILLQTPLPRPHDNVPVDAFLSGDGWGYGANFGILYKFSDKLQVGVSGKLPSKISLEGDITNALYAIYNDSLLSTALSQAQTPEELAQLMFIFASDNEDVKRWTNNADADLKLPGDIGIGFAYNTSEKITLTMDLTYTLWSRLDSIVINIDTTNVEGGPPGGGSTELVINTKWEDTFRFSIGGLYRLSEPFELRGGFYYDPSPIPDKTFSPLFLDIGSKYSANLGAAVKLTNWEIGYNFEYIFFAEREIPEDPAAGRFFDNYPGKFDAYLIANHLSITYRF